MAAKRNMIPSQFYSFLERTVLIIPSIRHYMIRNFGFRLLRWLMLCVQSPEIQPLVLSHIRSTTSFHTFRNVLDELSRRLDTGQGLGRALDHLSPLPRRIALQLQIGEKMGSAEVAIAQVIEAFETELNSAQSSFGRGVFLIGYLLIGSAIAFSVIALYLPIFQMGSVV